MRTYKKSAFVGALTCAAITLAAGPALADATPPAYLLKTQYLTDLPDTSMSSSCTSKTIYLDAGYYEPDIYVGYDWGATFPGYEVPANGYYNWATCLVPKNSSYELTDVMVSTSTYNTIYDQAMNGVIISNSGTYTWGIALHHL